MLKYLHQPYPSHVNKWKTAITISLFVGLFMLIFQPFGLADYRGSHKALLCMGYGLVTFVAVVLNTAIVQPLFKSWFASHKWTVLKQIVWLSWIIFSIGLGNFIYTAGFFSMWSIRNLLYFQFFTLATGLIPIIVLTIVNQNRLLAQNLKSAQEFNTRLKPENLHTQQQTVTLVADNDKDNCQFELSNLLYIESTGNYIEVYLHDGNKLKKVILRSSLKRMEMQLESCNPVIKCHRAFLINADNIKEVKGNSQGLRLALRHTEIEIPVSRNFARNLKEKISVKI
jgi:hypothetical protein